MTTVISLLLKFSEDEADTVYSGLFVCERKK